MAVAVRNGSRQQGWAASGTGKTILRQRERESLSRRQTERVWSLRQTRLTQRETERDTETERARERQRERGHRDTETQGHRDTETQRHTVFPSGMRLSGSAKCCGPSTCSSIDLAQYRTSHSTRTPYKRMAATSIATASAGTKDSVSVGLGHCIA
eukprot:691592-Rhodomonas_salina.1